MRVVVFRLFAAAALTAAVACSAPLRTELAPQPAAPCRPLEAATLSAPVSSAVVRWFSPTDGDNRRRLASWCAAVGSAVFSPPPGERRSRTPPDLAELAIVSWNTHVGAADVPALVNDLRRGLLTRNRPVRDFVLLLQEVTREGPDVPTTLSQGASAAGRLGRIRGVGREVTDLASRIEAALFYAPSMRDGRPEDGRPPADRGNAILSTVPLSSPAAIELPGRRQRRVALVATIDVRVQGVPVALSVSVAHLDTLGAPWTLWLPGAPALRATQAKALIAALPSGPLALGADLNTWLGPIEPAAQALRRHFPGTPVNPEPTFAHGLQLDYLFFRPPPSYSAQYQRIASRYGSDHHPLVAWFTLSTSTAGEREGLATSVGPRSAPF